MPIDAPAPNPVGQALIASLKESFRALDERLSNDVRGHADGRRELALARTRLEEAAMWATKAVCNGYPSSSGKVV